MELQKAKGRVQKKKKNLEFSRFSGWVGLKKPIFRILFYGDWMLGKASKKKKKSGIFQIWSDPPTPPLQSRKIWIKKTKFLLF